VSVDSEINACTVLSEKDEQFGDLCVYDAVDLNTYKAQHAKLPSQLIERSNLSHLTEMQQCELLRLLDKHVECFSDLPGLTNRVEHTVNLLPGFTPKRLREYKVPEHLKTEVERQLDEMLANGVIRESNSPVCSPLVCVLKGRGGSDGVRLAVDFRYVNSYTVADAFPIPDIDDVIQRIGGKKYISLLDCRHVYWQTPVAEKDKWLTAFVCMGRLLEFNRTPFGMKNAGQTFVRAMQVILRPLKDFADSYVDDSAVFSDEWKFHLSHLDRFLSTMRKEGITLGLRKCKFAQHSIKFCGEIIGSGIRCPNPEKVAAVQEMKVPENKKQLRGMLGLFSYFRKHIPAYAEITRLLTDLTAKRTPNNITSMWTEKHTEICEGLKSDLMQACNEPLHIVRFDRTFQVHVDASAYAAAGVITQEDDRQIKFPIAFFSVKLTRTQRNWSTIEREAFVVLLAVKKFSHWFYGTTVIVYSDHNPLTYLTASAPKSSKLMRWSLALAEFNLEFRYRAGKHNVVADTLSRPEPGNADQSKMGDN